jgi:IclR family transcriptional regulator, KDG regulon repressor
MIQSLERALDFLEYLSQRPGEPVTGATLADHFDLNRSTALSLLKTLLVRGYVEQAAPRGGYLLGPMAYYLVRHGPYARDIVTAAEPVLTALAAELQEHLVLARLHRDRLFMLYHAESDQVLSLRSDLVMAQDLYRTANGRLLLAYLPEAELAAFLSRRGLPGAEWSQVGTEQELRLVLEELRAAGRYVDQTDQGVVRASYPVWQDGKVVAALGLYAPAYRLGYEARKRALAALALAAEQISTDLSGRFGKQEN